MVAAPNLKSSIGKKRVLQKAYSYVSMVDGKYMQLGVIVHKEFWDLKVRDLKNLLAKKTRKVLFPRKKS